MAIIINTATIAFIDIIKIIIAFIVTIVVKYYIIISFVNYSKNKVIYFIVN